MGHGRYLLLNLVGVLFFAVQVQASALQYVMPDYYLGQFVRGILMAASEVGYHQYDVLEAPAAQAKAQASLQKIYQYSAFKYTYDKVAIVVIQGVIGEPNGFSFGANIFLTKSMIDLLSPNQLTAVIAHELAHSEKAHNLQKAPLPLEATVYQLKTIYNSVKTGHWPKGKALVESIQDLIYTGGLAMELQADCVAAQQLEYMRARGLSNQAADLNSATSAVLGFDVTKDSSDDPSAIRAQALLNKTYSRSCRIF